MKSAYAITREGLKIVFLTSLISTIGGIGLESVEEKLFSIVPLIILVPAMNNLTGSFGTIMSSKFTSILYMKGFDDNLFKDKKIRNMIGTTVILSIFMGVYIAGLSIISAKIIGFAPDFETLWKLIAMSIGTSFLLSIFILFVVVNLGIKIYRKNQDPDNFLIPITTAIADFGSMTLISIFVITFF